MPLTLNSLLDLLNFYNVKKLWNSEKIFKHHAEKIEFIYTVDHYEVSSYCFPFGIDTVKTHQKEIDVIADSQVARYHLFEHDVPSLKRIVFFDEYNDEYSKLGYKLSDIRQILVDKNFEYLLNALEDLPLSISNDDDVKLVNFVYDHFSVLFFYFSGLLSNGLEKFSRLNKRFIFKYDQLLQFYPEEVAKAFQENQPGQFAQELFSYIRLKYKYDEKTPEELIKLYRRITNQITDCEVIDRLLNINSQLTDDYLQGRTKKWFIVLFISSTNTLRQSARTKIYKSNLPHISKFDYLDPFRSLAEWYLFLLSHESTRIEEFENLMEFLSEDDKLNQDKDILTNKPEFDKLKAKLQQRIVDRRQLYENRGLLEEFQNLSLQIPNRKLFSNDQTLEKKREIFERAVELFKKIDRTNIPTFPYDQQLAAVLDLKNQGSFRHNLLQGIQTIQMQLNEGQELFQINRGKDLIEGTNQHLPIAFKITGVAKNAVNIIVSLYLNPFLTRARAEELIRYFKTSKLIPDDKSADLETAPSLIDKIYPSAPQFDELLVRCLIYLILPHLDISFSYEDQAFAQLKSTIKDLERLLKNTQNSIEANRIRENLIEYLYVAAWIARRNLNYGEYSIYTYEGEAQEITDKGKSLDPSDPRFWHSSCLISYSKAMKNEKEVGEASLIAQSYFTDSLHAAEACLKLLEDTAVQHFEKPITGKLIATLYNTRCYITVRLAKYSSEPKEQQNLLSNARLYWKYLMSREPKYQEFPEYMHTEAYLLFKEAQLNLEDKSTKLEQAKVSIEKSIQLKKKQHSRSFEGLYQNLQLAIEQELIINVSRD